MKNLNDIEKPNPWIKYSNSKIRPDRWMKNANRQRYEDHIRDDVYPVAVRRLYNVILEVIHEKYKTRIV